MADIVDRLGTVGLWGEAREEILRLRAEVARLSEGWSKANSDLLTEKLTVVGYKDDIERELNAHQTTIDTVYRLRALLLETSRHVGNRHIDLHKRIDAALKDGS